MSAKIGINHDMIVNTALDLAEGRGMESVTMANIARELGIKPPSLYNHIKGLDEIRLAMAIKAQNLLYNHLKEAVNGKESGPESVKEMGKAYLSFAHQYPGLYEASLLAPDQGVSDDNQSAESIIDLTLKALSVYSLKQEELIHAVRGLRSILHGIADLDRKGGFKLQVGLIDSLEVILETFLNGLKDGGTSSPASKRRIIPSLAKNSSQRNGKDQTMSSRTGNR